MEKIIGYRIKDSYFSDKVERYNIHKDLCSLQEFMVYFVGVPLDCFKDYFDKNNLPYDINFKVDHNRAGLVWSHIMAEYIGDDIK